jgi:hypothetical protein
MERMVPDVRPVTHDFAETSEAKEDAPQHLQDPKCKMQCLGFGGCPGGDEGRFLLSCRH